MNHCKPTLKNSIKRKINALPALLGAVVTFTFFIVVYGIVGMLETSF